MTVGKVLSQVDTIKALGEALAWFQREISWGTAPAALPHLTGRIGELFAAVTKNGEMASAVNQRGYDVMTKERNERISVKTITSSTHVTFNANTFEHVNRVLILKIVIDGDEVSIETILDEDAETAKGRCTTDGSGNLMYVIRRTAPARKLDEADLNDEAAFGPYLIRQYVNGTIIVNENGSPVSSAIAALKTIAAQIGVEPTNSNGNARNTRQLGGAVIAKLKSEGGRRVMKVKEAPEAGSPIANLQKAAKRAKDEGDMTQAEKFAKAARDLGADQDEDAFKGVLRKLSSSAPLEIVKKRGRERGESKS